MSKEELRKMSLADLEHLWRKKVDETVMIKKEIDRRKGEETSPRNGRDVNFEDYVTK